MRLLLLLAVCVLAWLIGFGVLPLFEMVDPPELAPYGR